MKSKIILIITIVVNLPNIHMFQKNIKAEKIEIAEEYDLLNGNNELITNEEMKLYKIEPNSERIKSMHDILRKYSRYAPTQRPKKKKKLKLFLDNDDYASSKLVFTLNFNNKKRESTDQEETTKKETNETESYPQELTLTSDEREEYEYDYDQFKNEYYDVNNLEKNESLKIVPTVKEKKMEDAMKKITDISIPTNCTEEDKNNYGIRSIECLIKDIRTLGMTPNVRERTRKIIIFWTIIYLIIVIPLWLIKGWCCCCCPFKFCKPYDVIYEVKMYIVRNPPGVIEEPNGEVFHYEPIPEEIKIFRTLELNVFKFR